MPASGISFCMRKMFCQRTWILSQPWECPPYEMKQVLFTGAAQILSFIMKKYCPHCVPAPLVIRILTVHLCKQQNRDTSADGWDLLHGVSQLVRTSVRAAARQSLKKTRLHVRPNNKSPVRSTVLTRSRLCKRLPFLPQRWERLWPLKQNNARGTRSLHQM